VAFDRQMNSFKNEQKRLEMLHMIKAIEDYGKLTASLLYSLPFWVYYRTMEWIKFEQVSDFIFE
jgi:hypothetical protein